MSFTTFGAVKGFPNARMQRGRSRTPANRKNENDIAERFAPTPPVAALQHRNDVTLLGAVERMLGCNGETPTLALPLHIKLNNVTFVWLGANSRCCLYLPKSDKGGRKEALCLLLTLPMILPNAF
jgi:hypothetical protein